MPGSFELIFNQDGQGRHVFTCPGQSYPIEEEDCDRRQGDPRFNRRCLRCTVRKGGKNDPRATDD